MPQDTAVYTHGHHESVLRAHTWRTAENSAKYLLSSLKPDMHILDIGCGPGTITADLAALVPQGRVVGLDYKPAILEQAQALADKRGFQNIEFVVGDIHALDYPDGTFDVVHAHQVLQHIGDPIQGLQEMRRVAKPGGIVAVRESDYEGFIWSPYSEGLNEWKRLYLKVARSNGGEPNAGRHLLSWARKAGYDRNGITSSASTWCYATPEEIAWWTRLWADRVLESEFGRTAKEHGHTDQSGLERIAQTWRDWGKEEDGWFIVLHGELLCRV